MVHEEVRSKKYAVTAIAIMALILFAGCAEAAPSWESSATVLTAARSVLPATLGGRYDASTPDTQGWIRACHRPLSAKVTALTRWSATVQVRCPSGGSGSLSWSLYVPFQRSYLTKIMVARHFLAPGAVIGETDVRRKVVQVNAQTGPICTHLSEVTGHTLRAGVPEGYPLRPQNLASPLLIRQGERVILEAHYGDVLAKAVGTALNDGRVGNSLLVRNNTSHKVLTGVVEPNGSVSLTPGDTE